MSTISFSVVAALALLTPVSLAFAADDAQLDARAKEIHAKVLTIDAHADVLLPSTPKRYWGKDGTSAASLDKLKAGKVDAIALSIAVGPGPRTAEGDAQARTEADERWQTIQAFVRDNSKDVAFAASAADIERLHGDGKIAVLPSFLNARSLGKDVKGIDQWYQKGVRLFAFTHAGNNAFADSSRPSDGESVEHHGLSPLGKQAVARLNTLGGIIDVSQLTTEGFQQVIALTKAPVIASHSAARALVDNTRSLSDLELDAIKKNGGVVHVPPFNSYLVKLPPEFPGKVKALRTSYGLTPEYVANRGSYTAGVETLPKEKQAAFTEAAAALVPRASLADYVDHIDYIAKRIGVEHVGIGSDFNHGSGITGFATEADAPNVTRELVRRGYTEDQIAKIWGGNFLRVFRQVEATAAQLKRT